MYLNILQIELVTPAIDGNFNNTIHNILFYAQLPAKNLMCHARATQNSFQFKFVLMEDAELLLLSQLSLFGFALCRSKGIVETTRVNLECPAAKCRFGGKKKIDI